MFLFIESTIYFSYIQKNDKKRELTYLKIDVKIVGFKGQIY